MAHWGLGEDGLRVLASRSPWLGSSSNFSVLLGGGVRAASPSGNVGGVGGHSTVDMIVLSHESHGLKFSNGAGSKITKKSRTKEMIRFLSCSKRYINWETEQAINLTPFIYHRSLAMALKLH